MTSKQLDTQGFRQALGQFPTGVTIMTSNNQKGEPTGLTASSFNSVSLDPALILWSIDKSSNCLDAFKTASHFGVNVLSKEQIELSNRFANGDIDKFAGVNYRTTDDGMHFFDECAAHFECKTWNIYEGGDHYIIVGEVLHYRYFEDRSPLVFSSGQYKEVVSLS